MNLSTLIDTPRIFTAVAEFGACVVYVILMNKRATRSRLAAGLAIAFAAFCLYQTFAGILPLWLWIPGMAGAVFLIYLTLFILCSVTWKDALFFCARAFVLAEFAASLHWQLYVWWCIRFQRTSSLLAVLSMMLVYTLTFLSYFLEERKHLPEDRSLQITGKELLGTLLIALGVFAISNLSFAMPNTPFSSANSSILYVRTLVDFGGIVMLAAFLERREEQRLRSENQAMNTVLQRQYDQYRMSIDNVEMLRREFHDLKHYMIAIRSEEDPQKKEQYLLEMEEAILTQEALSNTGNSVLDVVLTTKSTYCLQNNIHFTCMTDGKLISFMHVKDICSIFGNALDNAIECVSQFEDPEKRLITLSMQQKKQLILIQCENYTEASLTLRQNQLPPTTKDNKSCHGYGLKSIQYAAQKYGGSMTIQSEDHWFTLQVLIPAGNDA